MERASLIPLITIIALAVTLSACQPSPSNFTQERCVGDSTKLACTSNAVALTPGEVSFELSNQVGETINITGVSVSSDGDCALSSWDLTNASGASVRGTEIVSNEQFTFNASCGPQGSVMSDTFTFTYDIVGGVSQLQGSIDVVAKP